MERDWWNYGINPITGYKIDNNFRDIKQEQMKYEIETYGFRRE